ncbi:hypothetical protein M885DRAFT_488274 [Pelagophyceae sp. CCMP2097]|nr:hypothetical protein M885DRAFT_488274 [Pelagophyceae sp. CCMP2097]
MSSRAELEVVIEKAVLRRNEARKKQKFAVADELRKSLNKMGVVLQDVGPEKTEWKWTNEALDEFAEEEAPEDDSGDDEAQAPAPAAKPKKAKRTTGLVDDVEVVDASTAKKARFADDDDDDDDEPAPRKAPAAKPVKEAPPKKEAPKKEAPKKADKEAPTPMDDALKAAKLALSGGVVADILKAGTGKVAKTNTKISMEYVGTLAKNGRRFDAGKIDFRLGAGDVIKGWDVGCAGMRVGEKRRLHIPAKMGYGARGAPPDIPGNAALNFDVTLLRA